MHDVQSMLARAEAALVSDELADARDAFECVLRVDPTNGLAQRGVAEVTRELLLRAGKAGLTKHSRVRLAHRLHDLSGVAYDDDAEMDVVSVLARRGIASLPDLAKSTGLSEPAMLEAVTALVERGIVLP